MITPADLQHPSPTAAALAAEHGLLLCERGALAGWVAFDIETGFPVSDPMGLPAAVFDPSPAHPGLSWLWSWEYAKHRLDLFEQVANATVALDGLPFGRGADWVRAIGAVPDPGALTFQVVSRMLVMCETPMLPEVLWAAFDAGASDEVIGALVGRVWSESEFPDACLDHDRWLDLFFTAGFRRDGKPAEQPAGPVRLWRGSVADRRGDWSWTTDRQVAHRFAHTLSLTRPRGDLWTAVVPPEALLATNTTRGESEWVACVPDHLIEPDRDPCSC